MTIEMDRHPSEDVENELRLILMKYGPESMQQAVINLKLDPLNSATATDQSEGRSVEEAIQYYVLTELPDKAKTTQKDYGEFLKSFSQYCIQTQPDKLSTPLLQLLNRKFISGWINWRCPVPLKNTTRNKVVSFTRGFLKAVAPHEYETLKASLKFRGTGNQLLPRAFTDDQVKEFLEAVRQGGNGHRNYTMFTLLVGSGARISEVCPIQLKDIDFKDKTIKVHPKRAKDTLEIRYVNSDAFAILENYITYTFGDPRFLPPNDERYVFTGIGRKKPISTRAIQKILANLMTLCKTISEAERSVLSVHSFRHYFALTQLRSDVDIYTISVLLGHKSVKSTETYLRLFKDDLQVAVNRLDLTRVSDRHLALIHGRGDH